jgi:hypothetical protein
VDSAGWAPDQCRMATLHYWQSRVGKCYGRGARNWVYLPDCHRRNSLVQDRISSVTRLSYAAELRTKTSITSCSQYRHHGNYNGARPSGNGACCPRRRSHDIARLAAMRAARALPFANARTPIGLDKRVGKGDLDLGEDALRLRPTRRLRRTDRALWRMPRGIRCCRRHRHP